MLHKSLCFSQILACVTSGIFFIKSVKDFTEKIPDVTHSNKSILTILICRVVSENFHNTQMRELTKCFSVFFGRGLFVDEKNRLNDDIAFLQVYR